jgi:hypothetical protein
VALAAAGKEAGTAAAAAKPRLAPHEARTTTLEDMLPPRDSDLWVAKRAAPIAGAPNATTADDMMRRRGVLSCDARHTRGMK